MLEVRDLVVPGAPDRVTFSAFKGEILGFAGLIDAGRNELMEAIVGVTPPLSGQMMLDRKEYRPRWPRDAFDAGVYLVSEDRKHGLVLPTTATQNTSRPDVASDSPFGRRNRKTEQEVAATSLRRSRNKTPAATQAAVVLSGSDQQKLLAKWLTVAPKVLILDEPTRGIDVGSRAEIYRLMADLADRGITVLMVSSDLEETLGMSDRVVVMHKRRLKGVLERQQLTQLALVSLMTGRDARSIVPPEKGKTGLR